MLHSIEELLQTLEDQGIRYCNWKSNKELEKSLYGEIDIELLCDRKDATAVQAALTACGYKPFPDISGAAFPGLTNYIGYDQDSGALIHVHLHYELTVGTPYLKEYVSPWGSYVLDTRIKDPATGVWVSDPNVELVLLLVRYAMKIRRWNVLSRRSHYEAFRDEYEWLNERTDPDDIRTVSQDLLTEEASAHIQTMIDDEPDVSDFHRLRSLVRPTLRPYNTHHRSTSLLLPLLRKGFRGIGKLNETLLHRPIPTRRTPAQGGVEVAFVGIDGSGKSTHVENITQWLSWKVDTHQVYFGSGDGRSSLLRYPLKKLNQVRQRIKDSSSEPEKQSSQDQPETEPTERETNNDTDTDSRIGPAKALWAITLAREKALKRRRARRARNRGMIVIMDRYPQSQFPGYNDGPLLRGWKDSRSRILRWLSEWEFNIYQNLHQTPPDVVVKLQTSSETAKQRKPETPRYDLERKAETIDNLNYDNCEVIDIDTEQDLDTVAKEIKRVVWDAI